MTVPVANSVIESAFSLRLRWSLFLVKLQAFTINDNDRDCEGVSFW